MKAYDVAAQPCPAPCALPGCSLGIVTEATHHLRRQGPSELAPELKKGAHGLSVGGVAVDGVNETAAVQALEERQCQLSSPNPGPRDTDDGPYCPGIRALDMPQHRSILPS